MLLRALLSFVVVATMVSAGLVSSPAAAAEDMLLLAVEINGTPLDKIGEFTLRDGVMMATSDELGQLGIRVTAAAPANALVPLSSLPGLSWRLDAASQTIFLAATTDRVIPNRLISDRPSGPDPPVESSPGATVTYDVTDVQRGNRNTASGLFDMRLFSPIGVASTGFLAFSGGGPGRVQGASLVRLDSTYTFSDPASLRRLRIGDFVSGALAWTRPVRLAGVQLSSDFSLRPDLVTLPLPTIRGSAAVPSTIDVLVDQNPVLSGSVPAGPFEIPQVPVIDGAGHVTLAITDAIGRRITSSMPFYASASLLAPGLRTFTLQAGAIRRNFGLASNDYGVAAASATYRRGISAAATLEATAEAAADTVMAGAGLVVKLGDLAVLDAALAASRARTGTGARFAIGVQRIARSFSAALSVIGASTAFRDIAAISGEPSPRLQYSGSISASLGKAGSLALALIGIDRDPRDLGQDRPLVGPVLPPSGSSGFDVAEHSRIASLSYSVQLHRIAANLYGYHHLVGRADSGVTLSLTMALGGRGSVTASGGFDGRDGNAQLQAVQSEDQIGDWGYQLGASTGRTTQGFAEASYLARQGRLSAGIDRSGGGTTVRAGARGSLSFVDDRVFASPAIEDSFAVVDTNGLADVRVLDENRDVGRTDRSGRLLVPRLRSFDLNHLAIDPDDVPADTSIDVTAIDVRPRDRSGLVVRFPIRRSQGALLQLVDAYGSAIPVGSTAERVPDGAKVPVGYDGAAYLEELGPRNSVKVEMADGRSCSVTFAFAAQPRDIPTIGPLRCVLP